MCEVCHKVPCDNRCPNAPEPPSVAQCVECGVYLYVGDECYKFGDDYYCTDCMSMAFHTCNVEDDLDGEFQNEDNDRNSASDFDR